MASIFQHLLLATEHSEFDSGAEALALALAQRCQLPLDGVLPIVSNPEFEAAAPELATRAELRAATHIAGLHEMARAQGVSLSMQARRGPEPHQEIVDEARERGADLIVIRRRGKRGFLANLLLGEMVSRVVAHAPCSVLIVPRGATLWQTRVLVAAEPGTQGLRLVTLAVAVAAECGLPLQWVCVQSGDMPTPDIDAFMTQVTRLAQAKNVNVQSVIRKGKPFAEILAAAQECQADLIVIGSRNDQHIGRALVGGVAQKVIGLSDSPVLVLHPDTA